MNEKNDIVLFDEQKNELAEIEIEKKRLDDNEQNTNTKKAYESDFKMFEKWCVRIRRTALPVTSEILELYIIYLSKHGYKPASISRAMISINIKHRSNGFESPIGANVKNRFSIICKDKGMAQRKVAAVTVEHLKKMIEACPSDFLGIRDRAILLVGWTAALRRSEIAALDVEDMEERAEGIVLTIKRSKTDQFKKGYKIGLPIVNSFLCPVKALRKWLNVTSIKTGPVFRAIGKGGMSWFHPLGSRLSDKTISLIIKKRAREAGYDSDKFSGHSLRAGLATSAASAGIPERLIMHITGHTSEETVRKYIRDGGVFIDHPALWLLA